MSHQSTDEQFYAFVRCFGNSIPDQKSCGIVGLTEEQYSHQMDRPNSGWCCPHCGSTASYDDARSEAAQGVSDMSGHERQEQKDEDISGLWSGDDE